MKPRNGSRALVVLGSLLLMQALLAEAIFGFNNNVAQTSTTLSCDFYSKSCNWDGVNQWQWTNNTQSISLKLDGPPSLNQYRQFSRALVGDFTNSTGKQLQLTSPAIADSSQTEHCFYFSYYLMVDEVANTELRLWAVTTGGSPISLWYSGRRNADTWARAQVSIGTNYANLKLRFTASAKEGFIGIRDFNLKAAKCDTRTCNLESDDCGWTTIGTPYSYAFKVVKANTTQLKLKQDHTYRSGFGQLAYLENGNVGSKARIQSPDMENLGYQCFSFWFQRSSGNGVQLKVYTFHGQTNQYDQIWASEPARHLTDEWIKVSNSLKIVEKISIVVEATKTDNSVTLMAIDDLSFEPNGCDAQITCQYSDDGNFCGWKDETNKNDRLWSVGFGRVVNPAALTFSSLISNYYNLLYTDFTTLPSGKTSSMEILSEFVDSNTYTKGACLVIRYDAKMITPGSDVFELNQIDTAGNRVQLWAFQNTQNTQWQSQNVVVPNPPNNLPYRLSLRVASSHASTYVAIYSVVYSQEPWQCSNQFTRPPATPPPPPPTVGPQLTLNCDFENNTLCNWLATGPGSFQGKGFKVGTPSQFNNSLYFPSQDHTRNNTSNGHFAYLSGSGDAMTPTLGYLQGNNPYPNKYVCVTFWYFFYAQAGANFTFRMVSGQANSNLPVNNLFKAYGANDIRWRQAQFTLGALFGTFRFDASIVNGVVAVDDITVMPGQCEADRTRQAYPLCDFEGGMCNQLSPVYQWSNGGYLTYWRLFAASNISRAMRDHTTHTNNGHFEGIVFGIDKWVPNPKPYQLQTGQFYGQYVKCVRFAYYLEGLNSNTSFYYDLHANTIQWNQPSVIRPFVVAGSTSGLWFTHRYPLPNNTATRAFSLLFSIDTHGSDPGKAKVFIDDFYLDPNPCNRTTGCDFEDGDTCDMEPILVSGRQFPMARKEFLSQTQNYTKILKTNLVDYVDQTWHVFSPMQSQSYIQKDHSMGSNQGKYLLLHGTNKYDRGIMITRRFQLSLADNGTFCFSFALFKPTASSVFEVYQGEPSDTDHGLKLLGIHGATQDWQVFDVQTTLEDPSSLDIFFYLVGTLGDPSDYIALDDVQIVEDRRCNPANSPPGKADQSPSKGPSKGGIVAAVLVPLFVILGVALGYFGYRRYQASKSSTDRQVLSFNNVSSGDN